MNIKLLIYHLLPDIIVSMKLIKEILTIAFSVILVLIIVNTTFSEYLTQILAFITALSLLIIVIKKRKSKEILSGSLLEVFGITTAIFLTIFLTDAVNSPLFFLLYFLLFGIAFLMEPHAVFVFLAGILILFIPKILPGIDITELARLGGLILISPIAYFFGREFQRREKLEQEVEEKTEAIIEVAENVKNKKLEADFEASVDEIIEEASDLKKNAEDS